MNIRKFCDIYRKKRGLTHAGGLKDIIIFFRSLSEGLKAKEAVSEIIANYLYENIACEERRKRKATARDFEDFLEMALGGKVMDRESRKNVLPPELSGVDRNIADYISSNRREKMDIVFPNGYGISVKTSMPDNSEINMGSFAREALFLNFLSVEEYGGERKSGLGSKPQILDKFLKIYHNKEWAEFCTRFELMVNSIYVDDLIYVIKGGSYLLVYCLEGSKLRNILIEAMNGGPHEAIKVINRYEGNSLRIDRERVMQMAEKIRIDFSQLANTRVKKFLEREEDRIEKALLSMVDGKIEDLE